MVNAQYGAAFAALGVVIALGLRPAPVDRAGPAPGAGAVVPAAGRQTMIQLP
jgi:hypothetical protein